MKFFSIAVFLFTIFYFPQSSHGAPYVLTPANVIQRVIENGLEAKNAKYQAEKPKVDLIRASAIYDIFGTASVSYDYSKLESLTGFSNKLDRYTAAKISLSKKIPTGSTFSLGYGRNIQDSILNPFNSALRPPKQTENYFELGLRQDLLANSFGTADRARVASAEKALDRATLNYKEEMETIILRAIRMYWDAYIAKETYAQSLKARDKYEYLIKVLSQKQGLGLDDRGELSKAKAEFQNQEGTVQIAQMNYQTALDHLFQAMQTPAVSEIEFQVPEVLPTVNAPKISEKTGGRKLKAAQLAVESAELDLRAMKSLVLPDLALIGKAGANGIDKSAATSFNEATDREHPHYVVGLEFSMRLGTDLPAGEKAYKQLLVEESSTILQTTGENESLELERVNRDANAKYTQAQASIEALKNWEKAVAEQDRNFRRGRISTSELILDYNSLFRAQSAKSAAVGGYYYSLHELAAAQDLLVP